ncbi:MAG TPA: hypothetical protein PK583_03985, partial [Gammaproteobacteria bacterium]|nr:hypothetical protein [Gammaproteobacteria bacterium]
MLVSFSFSSIPSRILNFLFCLSAFLGCCEPIQAAELSASLKPLQIGILIPMEHAALRDIVAGFETIVRAHYP